MYLTSNNMEKFNKTISEIWNDNYIVPLYQRNFAWQETQIQQLLQDIYDHCGEENSHYYIGSLVVLQRFDGTYEVIDGQQRLTVLHLICKSLGLLDTPHLKYDSRPEVEGFFQELFASGDVAKFLTECYKRDNGKIYRLVQALDIVETTEIKDGNQIFSLETMPKGKKEELKKYIDKNVVLVRTILPADTDVAAYFEIMNNRGEQLQEHEVVKALMMKKLEGKRKAREVFADIWNACSQMNVPIQRALKDYWKSESYDESNDNEKSLFGNNYDTLNWGFIEEKCNECPDGSGRDYEGKSIEDILSGNVENVEPIDYENELEYKYEPIIDFPNFLMHMLKLELEKTEKIEGEEIPLNSDKLLSTYKAFEGIIEPMEFIGDMLKMRVMFDRYIIKVIPDWDEEENVRWVMQKPYCSEGRLKFRNTFSKDKDDEEDSDGNEGTDIQKRLIKVESMLQVTFRQKKYKNWLFETLKWLKQEGKVESVDGAEMLHFLNDWSCRYYDQIIKEIGDNSIESLGTGTSHFVFNFIDYLYWSAKENVDNAQGNSEFQIGKGINHINDVQDFSFHYYNSVEHHLPQSYVNTTKVDVVDNIGNLCLISRRANSSLNDKSPKEKANLDIKGLQPKRRIMYCITQNDGVWEKEQIEEHRREVLLLLDNRKDILYVDNE